GLHRKVLRSATINEVYVATSQFGLHELCHLLDQVFQHYRSDGWLRQGGVFPVGIYEFDQTFASAFNGAQTFAKIFSAFFFQDEVPVLSLQIVLKDFAER